MAEGEARHYFIITIPIKYDFAPQDVVLHTHIYNR